MLRIKQLLLFLMFLLFPCYIYAQQDEQTLKQYELVNLEFKGNKAVSSSTLADAIVSKQTPNWLFKFLNKISESLGRKPSYFDSTKIPADLHALKSYYQDNGFFNAKFTYNYKLDKDKLTAELIYNITEGERFYIRSFRYRGLDSLPHELTRRLSDFTVDSTKPYSKTLVEQNTVPFVSYLRDNGYMLGDISRPLVNIYKDSGFVDVRARVFLGRRYIIDSIKIEKRGPGKDEVQDTLVKKIVSISPGDYYSADEKQRAQVRLYRTNLFSSVLVSALTSDTTGNYVPLNVTADIGPMNELSPEIIINNQNNTPNVGLGANYLKRNFLGNARTFTLSGNFAIQDIFRMKLINLPKFLELNDNTVKGYLDLRASVEQPYTFNKRITTRLEGYWTDNKIEQYKVIAFGGKINFDFELPKFVYMNSLQTYYSAERSIYDFQIAYIKDQLRTKLQQQNISPNAVDTLISNNLRLESKRNFTSLIGVDIGANKTNDILFPTSGYYVSLTVEEANLLPAIIESLGLNLNKGSQFYRLQTTISMFPNIYNSTTNAFGIKLKVGYLQTYKGSKEDVPIDKTFTAGGSNSVRGWHARELIPAQNQDIGQTIAALRSNANLANYLLRDFPLGGTFLLEGSFESRNRLFGQFGMAFFVDYGNTWQGYQRFNFNELAVAFGFGFRYYSPFAPFRLDLGFKAWDPNVKQNFFQINKGKSILEIITFQFGIGEAF